MSSTEGREKCINTHISGILIIIKTIAYGDMQKGNDS